ncbi:hypothetical protein J6590_028997 [Homalodisca vitripennis]|nr:hypothetical protein J6590_028997 [Homalodisca vitripennis]
MVPEKLDVKSHVEKRTHVQDSSPKLHYCALLRACIAVSCVASVNVLQLVIDIVSCYISIHILYAAKLDVKSHVEKRTHVQDSSPKLHYCALLRACIAVSCVAFVNVLKLLTNIVSCYISIHILYAAKLDVKSHVEKRTHVQDSSPKLHYCALLRACIAVSCVASVNVLQLVIDIVSCYISSYIVYAAMLDVKSHVEEHTHVQDSSPKLHYCALLRACNAVSCVASVNVLKLLTNIVSCYISIYIVYAAKLDVKSHVEERTHVQDSSPKLHYCALLRACNAVSCVASVNVLKLLTNIVSCYISIHIVYAAKLDVKSHVEKRTHVQDSSPKLHYCSLLRACIAVSCVASVNVLKLLTNIVSCYISIHIVYAAKLDVKSHVEKRTHVQDSSPKLHYCALLRACIAVSCVASVNVLKLLTNIVSCYISIHIVYAAKLDVKSHVEEHTHVQDSSPKLYYCALLRARK